jgi:small subunit ribosomal protein S17
MSAESSAPEADQNQLRTVSGQVVSDKMDKTISVSISRVVKHPVYGKYIRRTTKVLAHDEDNSCKAGDVVSISECKPRSKRKAWQVVEILERAEAQ